MTAVLHQPGVAAQMTGVPPGLEYMTILDQLVVHRQVELFESESPLRCLFTVNLTEARTFAPRRFRA